MPVTTNCVMISFTQIDKPYTLTEYVVNPLSIRYTEDQMRRYVRGGVDWRHCYHTEMSLFLHIYDSYLLYVYIPLIVINHTMIMVSYENETRKLSIFLGFNCC